VTLARLKGPEAALLQTDLLPTFPRVDCTPESFCLFESRLRPEGPEYREIESWDFIRPPSRPTLPE
jgi:2'-5' RNA ligase